MKSTDADFDKFRAMRAAYRALENLDQDEFERALEWIAARFRAESPARRDAKFQRVQHVLQLRSLAAVDNLAEKIVDDAFNSFEGKLK